MTSEAPLTIRLNEADNVVVASRDLEQGTAVPAENVTCSDRIRSGHKVAVRPIPAGEPVIKYSQIIGFASRDIQPGQHVHTHNVELKDFARDYAFGVDCSLVEHVPEPERALFQGIVRSDGRVATRNYIGVISTVNCSASVAHRIADAFRDDALAGYPNIDGVVALTYDDGCGIANTGPDMEKLQRTFAGYARHPNFAGVLLVGLGCEAVDMKCLTENMNLVTGPFLHTMLIQDSGGSAATVRKGVERIREMLPEADRVTRTPVPASHLILGLECGGSDAYSGITANPALGAAVDLLVRNGGTAVLSETAEIFGAEHLLTRRACSPEVGRKLVDLIHWWEDFAVRNRASLDNNPTPGNKAGGLTSILEKSLGAVSKGGTTTLMDVYQYAEPVTAGGFVFMDTPGFDPASITGMVAGGANVVCFTTGRGSVFGGKPTPSIKLASNSAMYGRMKEDMDINCGEILEGTVDIEEMGRRIFQEIIDVASGKRTKSELFGVGDMEFAPWHPGAMF